MNQTKQKPESMAAGSDAWCTVVIPCYNEQLRLPLQDFSAFLNSHAPASRCVRFIFVNDGSRDNTLRMLEDFAARYPERVKVLDQQPNAGKAEAVRVGMLQAIAAGDTAYTGFWDADLAAPLEQIPDLLALLVLRPELHMIFGARVRLMGRAVLRSAGRHYLSRVFATVVSLMLRLPIYDTQCGAKLFRVNADLKAILTQPFLTRWIFDVEILARLIALHKTDRDYVHDSIYEFPLPKCINIGGSKVRSLDFLRAFGDLMRIYRAYL